MKTTKGVLLATAAAALFVSQPILAEDVHPVAEGKVKCWGANACQGAAECNTKADVNACKEKNKCKEAGWISLTKEECEKIPGTKVVE